MVPQKSLDPADWFSGRMLEMASEAAPVHFSQSFVELHSDVVLHGVADEEEEEPAQEGVVRVKADIGEETADAVEALARLKNRTAAEELNLAASFWVWVWKEIMDGGSVLLKDKKGRVGPIELTGAAADSSNSKT